MAPCLAWRWVRRRTNQALLSATKAKKLIRLELSAACEGWLGRALLVLAQWSPSSGSSPSFCRWSSRPRTTAAATSWFDPGRPAADDLSGGLLAAGGGATPVGVRARAEGSFEKSRGAGGADKGQIGS